MRIFPVYPGKFKKQPAGLRQALFKKVEQKPASKGFAIIGGGVHLLTGMLMRLFKQHAAATKAYERYLHMDPLAEGAEDDPAGDTSAEAAS